MIPLAKFFKNLIELGKFNSPEPFPHVDELGAIFVIQREIEDVSVARRAPFVDFLPNNLYESFGSLLVMFHDKQFPKIIM